MNDKTDRKVTDLRNSEGGIDDPAAVADALQAASLAGQDAAPTHWGIPIPLAQAIIKYLKKQPMDDVEQYVYGIQEQAVPITLTRKD